MNAQPQPPRRFEPLPHRVLTALLLMSLVVIGSILVWLYIVYFRSAEPAVVPARIGSTFPLSVYRKGHNAYVTLQTVGTYGHAPHPDWVSYMARTPQGKWEHSTVIQVPSYSVVHVTVYEFDTQTGVRNPFLARARGVLGHHIRVNGKSVVGVPSTTPAHTFTIPGLGVSVPLFGVGANAKNQCSATPCTLSEAHNTITFSFRTARPATYRWQCFVPCAASFIYGWGGPMQTLGWMDGFIRVVPS